MTTLKNSSDLLAKAWKEKARRKPGDPYAWAMKNRRIGGEMLMDLPALVDIANDRHRMVVIQKSAQVGLTELLVNIALHAADTGYAGRGHVLFLMPTQNVMTDFSQARFDRAIQDSPYIRSRLQSEPPRRKGADSTRLKRIGPGYIFLRGADSRQVASVDADIVLLDEFDQMADGTLERARARIASSRGGQIIVASTPRYPETGVNGLFLQSDQRYYHLPCPACHEEQRLTWEENVDKDRKLVVCRTCLAPMDVTRKGRWIPSAPGNTEIHGYHMGRLYSPLANIAEMIDASLSTSAFGIQEFMNSDLGLVYSDPGGGITLDELDRTRADYRLEDYQGQPCFMGVDAGKALHVVIRESKWRHGTGALSLRPVRGDQPSPLWYVGTATSFDELDVLMERFHVSRCVVDGMPETRSSRDFAGRHRDVLLAWYTGRRGVHEVRSKKGDISLDKTAAFDEAFQQFRDGAVELPDNARELGGRLNSGTGEYYRQMRSIQRTRVETADGNWEDRWVNFGKADHYANAEVYAWACGLMEARSGIGFMW